MLSIITLLIHLATITRYGYFHDELYFIACARHLAWGYVDQPPLVAIAAWLSGFFGYSLIVLRLVPAISAALTVWVTCAIVREFSGARFAQVLAGVGVMLLPTYLVLGNTLTTTSFEPLSWTLVVYLLIRTVRTGEMRWWPAVGVAIAFGMYGKYTMALFAATLLVGLLLTKERRNFLSWWFPLGTALALILIAPNMLWQFQHGWPMFSVLHGDVANRHAFQSGLQLEYRGLAANTAAFAAEQIIYANPILLPVWLTGLAVLMFERDRAQFRAFGIAYLFLFGLAILLNAKGYYIIGSYASLIAAGATAIERALANRPALRPAVIAAELLLTLPFVPISLPVLPIKTFIAYTEVLHMTGTNGTQPHLIQPLYAEEFGWQGLTAAVARVYKSLPAAQRAKTAVFADTFGDAAALDLYGSHYGLPAAISGQNNYYLWGTHGFDGSSVIAVGASQADTLRSAFGSVTLVTTYSHPYRWVVEGPTPIFICTLPHKPLSQLWPLFKWYGA